MDVQRTICCGFVAAVLELTAAGQSSPPAPVPLLLQNYKLVTAERLIKPDDSDWMMVRRTYDGWGYSPLAQITPRNVQRLQPAWVFATGVNSGHEAAPLVNNGVMFVATPQSQVIAIDAIRPAAAWLYTATKCFSRRAMRRWWPSTPRPAKKPGPSLWRTTRPDTT